MTKKPTKSAQTSKLVKPTKVNKLTESKSTRFGFMSIVVDCDRVELQDNTPHLQTPVLVKMIPAKGSWSPCYSETRDENHCFVSGQVRVRLEPKVVLVAKHTGKLHVQKQAWRVGADDTGVECIFDSKADAQAVYDALQACFVPGFSECPMHRSLLDLWGFERA